MSKLTWAKHKATACLTAILLHWLLALPVFADGKIFPAIAFPADVKIPDQSALLIWTNGVERLVIETRFVGEGTNFAWVVPLPAVPVIEPATTGLFPTLRHYLQPELQHITYSWWAVAAFVCGLAWLMLTVRRDQPFRVSVIFACLLTAGGFAIATHSPVVVVFGGPVLFLMLLAVAHQVRGGRESVFAFLLVLVISFVLSAMLLPALATGKAAAVAGKDGIHVLDRKIVGIFDTTTLTAKRADALAEWLGENGFAMAPDTKPIVEQLVRDGWVFVATKVHRETNSAAPVAPHPLSFTFKADKPVYPLRLTGAGSSNLFVELFVAGTERARIKGFKVTECRQTERAGDDPTWRIRGMGKLGHPQLLGWLQGATVLTRLEARLDAAAMQNDAEVSWENFRQTRTRLYSKVGAMQAAANWTVPFASVAVLVVGMFSHQRRIAPKRAARVTLATLLAAGATAVVIYAALPKVAVRMQRMPWAMARNNLGILAMRCADVYPAGKPANLDSIRQELARQLAKLDARHSENVLLGGRIHEEDSPGNYTLRETGEGVEIIGYDAAGTPATLGAIPRAKSR